LFQIDKNGDGYIDLSELKEALDGCGFKLPGWKVRQMIEEYDDKRQIHIEADFHLMSLKRYSWFCCVNVYF
jgi:plastin-3